MIFVFPREISERDLRNKQKRKDRLSAARAKGTHTKEQWQALCAEFSYRCVCCGCQVMGIPCKDHITPIYQGGSDGLDNIQPACRSCNSAKGPDTFNWVEYRRCNWQEWLQLIGG